MELTDDQEVNDTQLMKPRYLQAITHNNLPKQEWGPKKKANWTGLYSHLHASKSKNNIALNGTNALSTIAIVNENFQFDDISSTTGSCINETKF